MVSINRDLFHLKTKQILGKIKNKKDKIILMLGVYEERKGHQFIIEVYNEILKQNKETVLIMAGDGENEYKDQIHKEILKKD